tara:strand:- start:241 stop:522 length:282 start_codon:yes stop_codon:yes gene_type:complete
MKIVPYNSLYFNDCLSILKSNIPNFIDSSEESLYRNFLAREDIIYFICFKSNKLIACGGYGYDKKKIAYFLPGVLCIINFIKWDLAHTYYNIG